LKNRVIESLLSLGGIKNKENSINLLSTGLIIKCKDTGHKYTVDRVEFKDGKPQVICYRHYGPAQSDIVYIRLQEKDFKNYEAA
jgi:hypothetical protein